MSPAGGVGRMVRGFTRPFRPAPGPLSVEDRLDRWARRIAEFGVLDRAYLEAQVDRTFGTDLEAITFYVHNDGRRGLSLSPLIEPEWLRDQQPDPRMSWYDVLHQEDPALLATGPLFDAGRYVASLTDVPPDDRPATTLDALRHFLRTATDGTTVPAPPGRPTGPDSRSTWGAEHAAAMARARAFAAAQHRTRRRYRTTWDGPADADVLARYARGASRRDAEHPLVTVVLPTHDRADVVERAVASVVAQSYRTWELVVVDDGSTDATAAILDRVAAADDRLRVLHRSRGGAAAARNAGLAIARGEFVAFLDADNTWRPVHLAATLAALLEGDVPAVHDGLRMLGANNADDTSGAVETFRGEDGTLADLLAGNFIDLNALVVRHDVVAGVGPFDESLRRWIDYEWVLRIAERFAVPSYVPVLGVDYDNVLDPRRVSSSQPASWQEVALAPHLIDWAALESAAPSRDADLVSIVMPVYRDWVMTRRAVEAVLRAADEAGERVELVVIDNGSPRAVAAILGAWFAGESRVRVHRTDRNVNFGLGSDLGLAMTTGRVVVMLNNDTEVGPGWLQPLVTALDDPDVLGAQSLLLYSEGTVQAAGTVFGGDKVLPWHFLADHPRSDATRAFGTDAVARFSAITAAAAAFRATDLVAWRGFDPVYANGLEDVDLCLRAAVAHPGGWFAVVPASVVVHHESRTPGRDDARIANRRMFDERWRGRYPRADAAPHYAAAGLSYLGVEPGEPKGHGVMVRSSRPIVVRASAVAGRWAIKHDGSATALVDALVAEASRSGRDVIVDSPGTFYRTSSGLDDVTVLVGTSVPFVPQPGALNVWWDVHGDPDLHDTDFAVVVRAIHPAAVIDAAAAFVNRRTAEQTTT